jgi:hypothetical protein
MNILMNNWPLQIILKICKIMAVEKENSHEIHKWDIKINTCCVLVELGLFII